MAVAAEATLDAEPTLERARELARDGNAIPVRASFVDDCETPVSAFLKLRDGGPCFLLESAEQGRLGRYSFLGFSPRAVLRWNDGALDEWPDGQLAGEPQRRTDAPDPYRAVSDYLGRYRVPPVDGLPPFAGGAVGFFGYDLVRTVEPLGEPNPDPIGLPDLALMISDLLVVFDHMRHELTLLSYAFLDADTGLEAAYAKALETIADARERLRGPVPRPASGRLSGSSAENAAGARFASNMTREAFEANVQRIIEYVHAGDAFQVVPSQRFTAESPVEAFSIYRGLRTVNPSPYMYFLDFGDFQLAGASPEPLVKVTGRTVETRPIAGTYPRVVAARPRRAAATRSRRAVPDRSRRAGGPAKSSPPDGLTGCAPSDARCARDSASAATLALRGATPSASIVTISPIVKASWTSKRSRRRLMPASCVRRVRHVVARSRSPTRARSVVPQPPERNELASDTATSSPPRAARPDDRRRGCRRGQHCSNVSGSAIGGARAPPRPLGPPVLRAGRCPSRDGGSSPTPWASCAE